MSARQLLGILQVQIAGGSQDELPIYQSTLKLGRGRQNDVVLEDPNVSGKHAQFLWGRAGWSVEDRGSSNGTFVNGQLIPKRTTAPLRPGETVRIDQFTFQILSPQGREHIPPHLGNKVLLTSEPKPGLAVYRGGRVEKIPLDKGFVTLGRSSGNDVQINDRLVSGRHARLERMGHTYRIVDEGSTNGLTYQGQRVSDRVLADGDVVYIGQKIAIQYRAHIGFLPGAAREKRQELEGPKTQYLDMRKLPQAGQRITIGRHSSNTLRLKHPRVSRYHAIIEKFGARFRLRDLNSDNGTWVNDKRVKKEVWIQEGNEIRIASFRLIFQEDGITHFDEAGHMRLDALRLEKRYSKDVSILKRISLSIYPKEFVALVGASGAGKSTMMNTLTGFNPANGPKSRVLVNGKNLYTHMDEYRSEMGYVPQEDIIHRELSVYNALDYAARLRMPSDTSKKERHGRIMEVLGELGLEAQRNSLISALSGGQRKRVSIGVELLTKPGLFFLDEATSGLDPGTETEMMELLRKLADGGRTVILVTHATKNVMMCDQVVFLAKGGYLAYYGPPNEALDYFEKYRTTEERRYKEEIEFDDIYRLLETRGTPKQWGKRFRRAPQYKEYVVDRIRDLKEQRRTPRPQPAARRPQKRQVSALRQFWILSSRNLRIIAQDKVGLALMLAVAPLIGIMDFIWSDELFDVRKGSAEDIVTMLFMMSLIGVLTGALSSVREIVKEVDIYRRERTVVLKLFPYVLSKAWVGVILAVYQSVIFLMAKKVFVDPQFYGGEWGYPAMFVTIFLCTLSGYMIGLAISAASPNQNIALFLVVIVLVPQFLFAGALLRRDLIPGGDYISAATSTRWAFEALVRITGIAEDVVDDPCWDSPKEVWSKWDQEEKDGRNCRCLGKQLFELCYFPGIQNPDLYDDEAKNALAAPEPKKPPTPTPYPTYTPPPKPKDQRKQEAYQATVVAQGKKQGDRTKDQMESWTNNEMEQYINAREDWQSTREGAVRGAEEKIDEIFVRYKTAFEADVTTSWLALIILSLVFFGVTLLFQKQKDVI
jgi:ABC-type multidrug transport system ATPase subunit